MNEASTEDSADSIADPSLLKPPTRQKPSQNLRRKILSTARRKKKPRKQHQLQQIHNGSGVIIGTRRFSSGPTLISEGFCIHFTTFRRLP